MSRPTRVANVVLLGAATVASLVLCESGSRLVLNPVDFLSPRLVRDDILGHVVPSGSSGHDGWGFRNRRVPQTADVVALGDSHTYGNRATLDDAWPGVVARLTGKRVYNLGMGGYGPNQYYYLLQTKALALKPQTIVCGVYMGDDFDNAFRTTYGSSHWSSLRRENPNALAPDIGGEKTARNQTVHKRIRHWLSQHSILYRLMFHGVLQDIKGRYQVQYASHSDASTTSLVLPEKHVHEAFIPKDVLRGVDQGSPSVHEGMRITFRLLQDMNALCVSNHIQFIVAVIPTKEMVYARFLEPITEMKLHDTVVDAIANERSARQALFANLEEANIRYVDVLPAMEAASETQRLYTYSAADMHPNKEGYRVIAEAIAHHL